MGEAGDIGWAMDKIREGRKVRRAMWIPTEYIEKHGTTIQVHGSLNFIPPQFIAVQGELLANDWELYHEGESDVQEA